MPKGVYTRTEKHKRNIKKVLRGRSLKPKTLKCLKCNHKLKEIEITSSRQKYCKKCKKEVRRNQKKIILQKFRKDNKEKAGEQRRKDRMKRRAIENNIIETFTNKEWLEKLEKTKGFCPECKKWFGVARLTLDHIYPISKANADFLKTGIKRVYTIKDVKPLCLSCNCKKGGNFA